MGEAGQTPPARSSLQASGEDPEQASVFQSGQDADVPATFLDDKQFPSTSNAVERGNRRHRKVQKIVYRVRIREHIDNRIALDMLRDSHEDDRAETTKALPKGRAA